MILGINYNGMHDSSVCLVDDAWQNPAGGRRGEAQPSKARWALSQACARTGGSEKGRSHWRPLPVSGSGGGAERRGVPADPASWCPAPVPTDPYPPAWRARLDSLGLPLRFYDHHEMHAYTALVTSGLAEALVLTSDYGAYACAVTSAVFHVRQNGTRPLAAAAYGELEPLAAMYSDVTALLGFTPCRHEGKITGLAAHGRPNPDCRRRVWEIHTEIRADKHRLYDWVAFLDDDVPPFYEPNRHLVTQYRKQIPYDDADIARAAQDLLEEKLAAVLDWAARKFGTNLPLLLSGGLFANVKANMLAANTGFPSVFVCPPMGDDGLSLGAAMAAHHEIVGPTPNHGMPLPMALGPRATNDAPAALSSFGLTFRRADPEQIVTQVVGTLADGGTVAVVRGRQEFGPRALGRRSILASANNRSILDDLNTRLHRTEFMPFAPVLRDVRLKDVFTLADVAADVTSCLPYMTMCLPVEPSIAARVPAIVHVDGTSRPQVITEKDEPLLYRILEAYEERTGELAVINTSFNVHDQPLVGDAADAVVAFLSSRLDLLVLEDCLVEASANQGAAALVHAVLREDGRVARSQRAALNDSFGRQIVAGPGRFSINA